MALKLSDLPDEVLADILSRVPFSRAKVAAQCVCKTWQVVLQTSAAHSADTLKEDSPVEFYHNPTRVVEKGGGVARKLSEPLVNALASLKLSAFLPFVQGLQEWPAHMLQKLRHVESLSWLEDLDQAEQIFQDIGRLPNVKHFEVSVQGRVVDFNGPEGCKVDYDLHGFYHNEDPDSTVLEVPAGMARHLQTLHFYDQRHQGDLGELMYRVKQVNLGRLANCVALEEIYVDLPSSDGLQAHFYGLGELPPSVQHVYVDMARMHAEFPHLWAPAAGWLMSHQEIHKAPHLVFSRIAV